MNERYIQLLKRNAALLKSSPGSVELSSVRRMLTAIEKTLPITDIIGNTKIAFPIVSDVNK